MGDELYVSEEEFKTDTAGHFVTTEFEPVFDAAEFTRFIIILLYHIINIRYKHLSLSDMLPFYFYIITFIKIELAKIYLCRGVKLLTTLASNG